MQMQAIRVAALARVNTQSGTANTVNGTAVDLQPFSEGSTQFKALLDVTSALGTTPNFTAKIQESDSTASTSFTDISGAVFTAVTATTGNASPESIHFVTNKRYVRLVSVTDTNTTSAVFAAYLIGGQRIQ
jgi:hypothetical protein